MNNNLTIEWKFATFWLIFEFFISFALTAYLAKRLLLNRIRNRCKSLSGLNIVITNGHLKLSQELAKHLKSVYNCQTFLIGNDSHLTSSTDVNQQTIYQCCLLNHNDLQQLTKIIIKEAGHIDIVIENNWDTDAVDSNINCDEFIKTTSETIHSTLNLFAHLIPILCQSKHGGYFVTIQRQKKNGGIIQHPFLNTRSDMQEYINCLTSTKFTSVKRKIQLSTIIVANDIDKTKCLDLIDKIVNGLKTRKEIIDITSTNKNRSLIEYLVKLIKA